MRSPWSIPGEARNMVSRFQRVVQRLGQASHNLDSSTHAFGCMSITVDYLDGQGEMSSIYTRATT